MKHVTQLDGHQIRTMNRPRATALAAATLSVALIPTVVGAAAATASPSPWETVHEDYGDTFENFCVQGLTVVATSSIDYRQRTTTRGADDLPYYTVHITSFVDTYTNEDTGKVATNTGKYTFKTVSVTNNGDGTLTIIYQYTVNTQITDDAGRVVAHDTVIYRYVSVVDHGGTPSDPIDDTELESTDLLKTGLEPQACAAFVAALT
jgi:hypothetical protein